MAALFRHLQPAAALGRLRAAVLRFRDETLGSLSVEAVVILPVLMWAYTANLVWFDSFRVQNTNIKAGYAVADTLSRQTDIVTPEFIDGMRDLYAFLSASRNRADLRVTSIGRDPVTGSPRAAWSYATGDLPTLTNADLLDRADVIPMLTPGDTIIFVETIMDYVPPINVGLRARTFTNVIPTRPRFAPQIVFQLEEDGDILAFEEPDPNTPS
jgi:hypothetical protein